MPEIEAWQDELKDKVEFRFYQQRQGGGKRRKIRRRRFKTDSSAERPRSCRIIFDATWTPTAFSGQCGRQRSRSHPAVGDAAIRELVEKIKAENCEAIRFISRTAKAIEHRRRLSRIFAERFDGKHIDAKDLRGKKTLVTFWSTTCRLLRRDDRRFARMGKTKRRGRAESVVFSRRRSRRA